MDREKFYNSMTNEEKIEYNRKILNTKLTEEENILIENNIKLVYWVITNQLGLTTNQQVKEHYPYAEFDDLVQIGVLGLIKAIKTCKYNYYDENNRQNKHFSYYSACCIKNEILMYFRVESKKHKKIKYSINAKANYFNEEDTDKTIDSVFDELKDKADSFKKVIDNDIVNNIIRKSKEEILKYKCTEGTRNVMLFIFNEIINNVDKYLSMNFILNKYNNEYKTNHTLGYFTRTMNEKMKPLIAKICVEEDDTLNYNNLINRKRHIY